MTKAVKAKKHLGQHFLNNDEIALKITDLLSKKNNQVLEIGIPEGKLEDIKAWLHLTSSAI